MPEELDKPGVDNNQLEDCDRVSEFERIIYRQGFIRDLYNISYTGYPAAFDISFLKCEIV